MTFGSWQLVYLRRSSWIPEICGALAKSLLSYFFFCPNAPVYVFEGLESFYLNIEETLQHRIELNAKEAQSTVTAFQVARFLLSIPLSPPFAFAFTFLARRLHKARPRSGIVLLIHITLPGSTPSHLTAPMAKRLRNTAGAPATTDQQVSRTLIGAGEKSSWVTAEDKWRHTFQSNFPQSAFGTSSIHNSKLEERMSAKHE